MSGGASGEAAIAVYLALAEGDGEGAVSIAEAHWDDLSRERSTVLRLVAESVPAGLIDGREHWQDVLYRAPFRLPAGPAGRGDSAVRQRLVDLTRRSRQARLGGDIALALETAFEARDAFREAARRGEAPTDAAHLMIEWAMAFVVGGPMPRTGWDTQPEEQLEETYSWAVSSGDHVSASRAAAELAWLHAFAGRAATTQRWTRRASVMWHANTGSPLGASPAYIALSLRRSDGLDFRGAIEALAVLAGDHVPDHRILVATATAMYGVHLNDGVVQETRRELMRTIEAAPEGLLAAPLNQGAIAYAESYRLLLGGDPMAALRLLDKGPGTRLPLYAEARRASAALQRGDLSQAETAAMTALEEGGAMPRFMIEAWAALAAVQLRAGAHDTAREMFGRAVDLSDRERLPVALALTSSDDHARLSALLRDGHERPSLVALRERRMRRPERVDATDALTPQEQRVVRTIAEGLSVPEAATRLNVSVNTVKTQLRAVYRKLGATRREEMLGTARTRGIL
ncbi:helix-turn-helix transcriptional regulator [Microbacterium album]|uniref:HTH luxR-type domain-containing protein n=1 Tax=Microbacterium album TaxID=2053191 RepID=A0A917MK37_9MICO|nr:helix-turn-helix transcriptional regulator [Microbacterium album]GGH34376.1 hypothetical protein GCM10010921_02040 [Microbacterium album]